MDEVAKIYQKIVITGSNGIIGKLAVEELKKKGCELILLDKNDPNHPVDLLRDDLSSLFSSVNTVYHFAAYPRADIPKELALENLEMCRRVAEACKKSGTVTKIINASSINVYPFYEMYDRHETITKSTLLSPNLHFPPGEYARAKIKGEKIFDFHIPTGQT